MCLVCIEYAKRKLTASEALRTLIEMKNQVGEEHYEEASEKIYQEYLQEQVDAYLHETGFGD